MLLAAYRVELRVLSPQFSVLTNDAPGLFAQCCWRSIFDGRIALPHHYATTRSARTDQARSSFFFPRSRIIMASSGRTSTRARPQGREVQGSNKQTQAAGTRALGRRSANGLEPMRCLVDDTAASDFGWGPKQREPQGVKHPNGNQARPSQPSKTLGAGRCTGQGNPLTPPFACCEAHRCLHPATT